jgi:hypothetical protein
MQAESAPAAIPSRHHVTVSTADLLDMQPGDSFSLSIPGHSTVFEIVHDRVDRTSPQFAPTWVGHLKGYADDYRTLITTSGDHSVGRIATPEGNFQIDTVNGITTLTDLNRAGVRLHAFGDDALSTPNARHAAARMQAAADPAASETGAATNSVIDVLVLYNPSFVTATGNAQNAIANLISVANQAMLDSGVAVTFRLVATQLLSMSDADSNLTLLEKVTYPSDPTNSTLISDPVYTNVPALRNQYGADLVVAIRQFNEPVQQSCGVAWLLTDITPSSGIAADAAYAYAVVSYGIYQVSDNSEYVCDQVTMAHEMGHNMGSAHDRAHNTQGNPLYPYSYGYGLAASSGVPGFATIMAANYIQAPIVDKYSSPGLTCNGYVCGVSQSDTVNAADNVSSLNSSRTMVAQFRPTAANLSTTYIPATGYWWNPAEPGRGYNIEKNGNDLFMAAFLYDTTGRTTWYGVGPGAMVGNTFTGTLETYSGGQTLTGSFQPATAGPSGGNFSITFTSAIQATITWPGGTVPIQRYDFGPGGSGATQLAGTPQAGWWWAPTQGGRGFAIEVQGGSLFLAGYMYDASGNPVWYASGPTPMNGTTTYQGVWQQYGNGQTLLGAYTPAAIVNSNAGVVTIQFSSTAAGTMTFPNGTQVNIQRFPF